MRSIHTIVNKVVGPVAKKRGLVTAKIILEWDKIVGAEFAKWSRPTKVIFRPHRRNEGTLHLSINPSQALMVAHGQDILIDKINMYFGYKAVTKVTLVQIPFASSVCLQKEQHQKEIPVPPQQFDNRLDQALSDLKFFIDQDTR